MGEITSSQVIALVAVLNFLMMFGTAALMWRMRGEFVTRKEFDALSDRMNRMHDRHLKLEGIIEHLPTQKGFHELAIAMERLSGNLNVAVERITSIKEGQGDVKETLERHEDILAALAREAGHE